MMSTKKLLTNNHFSLKAGVLNIFSKSTKCGGSISIILISLLPRVFSFNKPDAFAVA